MEYDREGQMWSRYEQAYWETLLQLMQLVATLERPQQKQALVKLLTLALKERLKLTNVADDSFFEQCDANWWLSKLQAVRVKLPEESLNLLKFRYMLLSNLQV